MNDFLFTTIRKLGNETLQHKLQERINNTEKQPESKQCPHCHQSSYPVIPIVGLDNAYTRGARRLIAFADGNYYDRKASEMLKEFGCFAISHVTVADKATEISDEIHAKLTDCNEEVRKVFQDAEAKLNLRLMERSPTSVTLTAYTTGRR
ncbi:MAG: hypothetical protein LBU65_03585 [Planctomycetaceae bacterium]|jgi:hypothetical protein|nr:hypothetical protein [Planctomycetaceae bacterium]